MEAEMQKSNKIEVAFSKIKGCTGNSDVREMVTKYMTKEQTYAHLLQEVNKNEKKYDDLKVANEAKRRRLHDLMIEHDNKKSLNRPAPQNEKEQEEIESQMRQIEKDKDHNDPNEEVEYTQVSRDIQALKAELE
jgi:hypothetical protein